MEKERVTLRVPIGWKVAEAEGSLAVRGLVVIALAYRLVLPVAVVLTLAMGWASLESLPRLLLGFAD